MGSNVRPGAKRKQVISQGFHDMIHEAYLRIGDLPGKQPIDSDRRLLMVRNMFWNMFHGIHTTLKREYHHVTDHRPM